MKKIKDINYGNTGNPAQILDIYLPETDSFSVFIYFHGGGLESGDKNGGYTGLPEYLTNHNIAFVSCNYRMYPNAVYPEFIEDAAMAVAWVKNNMGQYGKVLKLTVGGSSAGGYLSMMLCFDKKYFAEYGINPDEIDGYVHDAGQPTSHFNVLRERGIDTRRVVIDETAPIFHIKENPNYAKMLVIVSDNDMPNRYEQTMLLMSTLKHFNGVNEKFVLKLMHGGHCQYTRALDENGCNKLAVIVADFISKL